MPSVRFLLLGTGFFARKWLETLKAHPDCTLAGVISRTPERAAVTSAELGLPAPAFPTLEQARARVAADAAHSRGRTSRSLWTSSSSPSGPEPGPRPASKTTSSRSPSCAPPWSRAELAARWRFPPS